MSAMKRRSFLYLGSGIVLFPALSSLACGGGDSDGGPDGQTPSFIVMNDDDSGHVHQLEIQCADLAAGQPVTYVATGPHEHTISLSADQVEVIASGEEVTISFTEGHSHVFAIEMPSGLC